MQVLLTQVAVGVAGLMTVFLRLAMVAVLEDQV
jgi:hypothetical protein